MNLDDGRMMRFYLFRVIARDSYSVANLLDLIVQLVHESWSFFESRSHVFVKKHGPWRCSVQSGH